MSRDPALARIPRLLFVSRHYASDFGIKVGGVFQRLRMLLDAAVASATHVDVLFLVDQRMIDEVGPAAAEASLRDDWGLEVQVHLAPRGTMRHGPFVQTIRALVDFRSQEDYFRLNGPAQFAAVRECVKSDTSLVVAHRLFTGSTVTAAGLHDLPVVMDLDDIEHRSRARQLSLSSTIASRLRRLELPALKRGELATVRACRTAFVCSQSDHEFLSAEGVANTTVVPNALRFDAGRRGITPSLPPTLFFIGTYGYLPNRDAAEYLIGTVFPLVQRSRPDARLLIAGESVERLPSFEARPAGVEFVGFVADLADVYQRVSVVCCPILAGGGTRIKIIEAAAAGKPVVSTMIGAEGLALVDDLEILVRDGTQAFVDGCIALLDDPVRAAAIGQAAFDKARTLYDRDHVVAGIAASYRAHARVGGPTSTAR